MPAGEKHGQVKVDGLRESGNVDELPRGLLARAAFFRVSMELALSRHDLEGAMRIAVWHQWPKVRELPGVGRAIEAIEQAVWGLPNAPPGAFTIAIARMQNDRQYEFQENLWSEVGGFEGVAAIKLPATVRLEGNIRREAETRGHKQAHEYIEETGASALIWGTVLRPGTEITDLFWTSRGEDRGAQRYPLDQNAHLQAPFWDDLVSVLRLTIAAAHTQFQEAKGQYLDLLHQPTS